MNSYRKHITENYIVYPHQVAGHRFEEGKEGMLVDLKQGYVLKPLQAPPRGDRELQFYQHVFEEDGDEITRQLRNFVPTFHGIEVITDHHRSLNKIRYLKLEDVTRNLSKPCILDVKIGRVVVDHLADEEKISRNKLKYPEQSVFGFRILGMKIYDRQQRVFHSYDKSFGKQLKTQPQITQALEHFFCPTQRGIANILTIINKCKEVKDWFLKQKKFKLFASSILMVYEGDASNNVVEMSSDTCEKPMTNNAIEASLHLVDFAHTFIKPLPDIDENYLFGIQNFIEYLEQLIER